MRRDLPDQSETGCYAPALTSGRRASLVLVQSTWITGYGGLSEDIEKQSVSLSACSARHV